MYELYKLNERIAKLTEKETERIANEAHEKMVKGVPEEELRLFINDTITASELSLRSEFTKKEDELNVVRLGLQKETRDKQKYMKAYKDTIYGEEHKKLLKKMIFRCIVWPFVIVIGIAGCLYCLSKFTDMQLSFGWNLLISIVCSIIASWIYSKFSHAINILKEWINRKSILDKRVQQRIDEIEIQ